MKKSKKKKQFKVWWSREPSACIGHREHMSRHRWRKGCLRTYITVGLSPESLSAQQQKKKNVTVFVYFGHYSFRQLFKLLKRKVLRVELRAQWKCWPSVVCCGGPAGRGWGPVQGRSNCRYTFVIDHFSDRTGKMVSAVNTSSNR